MLRINKAILKKVLPRPQNVLCERIFWILRGFAKRKKETSFFKHTCTKVIVIYILFTIFVHVKSS